MNQVLHPLPRGVSLGGIEARTVDGSWLAARASAWDALVADSASPQPFHARQVIAAHEAGGLMPPGLAWIAVTAGDRLVGLLPLRCRGAWLGWRRAAAAWLSPYMVTATPLLAADCLEPAAEALLDGLAAASGGGPVILPLMALESPPARALQAALLRRGLDSAVLDPFDRPVLQRRADAGAYEAGLGRSRRKSLRRLRNRLQEVGQIEMTSSTSGEPLAQAVEDFLALEAAGWKGRQGTALASRPGTAAFARHLFAATAGPVAVRADCLRLDGRPIAVSLAVLCGGTAFLLKTAYAEDLRRLGPGVVLEDEIVRLLHQDRFCERLDSAALPGTVLEDLYPDRERIGDLVLSPNSTASGPAFARLVEAERRRRAGIEFLKRLRRRLGS